MMSKVKNRGGKAELLLRRTLFSRGLRYRLHVKRLVGRPDIVFCSPRVVVFVDGDFWHGRALIEEGVEGLLKGIRSDRRDWWVTKLSANVSRDQRVTRQLINEGWTVLRYWESDILDNPARIADAVQEVLKKRSEARFLNC